MITLIQYNEEEHVSLDYISASEAFQLIREDCTNWLDMETTRRSLVEETADFFDIHHLIVEDILNLEHLPKFELFDTYVFITLKMLSYDEKNEEIVTEHLSIVMGDNLLITFQEGLEGDVFGELRQRISLGKGLARKYKVDYLFYLIINVIVEHYISIIEVLREKMGDLENRLVENPHTPQVVEDIMEIKKKINTLRKYTLPLRDAFNKMRVEATPFIKKTSINYFEDISNHLDYLISNFETSREMLKDLMDLHNSNLNNEMNKIMKTLTVLSAIFIPLTFIAGVYGMNFEYMPETDSEYGYFIVWGIMLILALGSVKYMRYKKWF